MTCNQIGIIFEFLALLMVIWRDKIRGHMTPITPADESHLIERNLENAWYLPLGLKLLLTEYYNWLISFFLIVG